MKLKKLAHSHRDSPSRQQEARTEREGAPRTPGSGNGAIKGDNRGSYCLCELKTTKLPSYRVKLAELHKLRQQSLAADKMPVLQLQLQNLPSERYAVLRWDDFLELLSDAGVSL